MSIPHAYQGRHAAAARPTGRRLAVAAAALAAGAVPVVCGGTAFAAAASAPRADLPATLGLPDVPLPLGLPGSVDSLTAGIPLAQDLPVGEMVGDVTSPLGEIVQVGDFGLLPHQPAQAAPSVRSAPIAQQPDAFSASTALNTGNLATVADRALSGGTQRAAERLTAALPLSNLVPQLASTSDGPLQLAPNVLHDGALGTLTSGVAPQTRDLTGGLVGQATPLVAQLRQSGVPTIGDVTTRLSATQLPVVGTVGSLTQTLPVTTVLGTRSPVTGAVQNLSGL